MATNLPLAQVYGIDSVAPVYYNDGNWRAWNFDQIYFGQVGAGKFVPTVNDRVDQIQGLTLTTYIVTAVHPQTLVATVQAANQPETNDNELDVYIQKGTFRAFVDKSVNPHRLSVDARMLVGGSTTLLCKIFRGQDTSVNGVVVSGMYNSSGEILDENIPLELVARDNVTNHTLRIVAPCHTTFDLINGEELTAIFYDHLGFVVSKAPLLVEESTFVRSTDLSRRYVTGIHLKSPFQDPSNAKQVLYPLNIPVNALNLMGVVSYDDGSSIELPVNGTRFEAQGLDAYAPTIVSQETDFVLKYKLSVGEYHIGSHIGDEKFVAENYKIKAAEVNGNYAVKLYAYPVWVDQTTGYRLEWFLYDLNRSIRYNVTPQVTLDVSYSTFQPKQYGTRQTLRAFVNLKQVNGAYKTFNHVQTLDVTLVRPGNERPSQDIPNWYVAAEAGQSPAQGAAAFATYHRQSANNWRVKLGAGHLTQADWLNAYYKASKPLYDSYSEASAPAPTHFRLIAGDNQVEYSIDNWNDVLVLSQGLTNHSTVYLQFLARIVENDLQLSTVGVTLFQVDENGTYI